jgi:hypothetical protein
MTPTNETPMIKVRLTKQQRADLQAAAAHPAGLYAPERPNRNVAGNLRFRGLLVEGPAVLEGDRERVAAEAGEQLRLAIGHAALGEFFEADTCCATARWAFKDLEDTRWYITPAGREAAATGFCLERE